MAQRRERKIPSSVHGVSIARFRDSSSSSFQKNSRTPGAIPPIYSNSAIAFKTTRSRGVAITSKPAFDFPDLLSDLDL